MRKASKPQCDRCPGWAEGTYYVRDMPENLCNRCAEVVRHEKKMMTGHVVSKQALITCDEESCLALAVGRQYNSRVGYFSYFCAAHSPFRHQATNPEGLDPDVLTLSR